MALDIPNESKVYTTVYDNSRGVDFTNDATNVFRRRSPCGKNMLPNIDGRPYKRSGWKVEIPEVRYRELYKIWMQLETTPDIEVVPDRQYYFELGGKDYLMIFNNIGMFSYSEDGLEMLSSAENLDSKKAFFFEGGGDAGFYFFQGNILFRYNGTSIAQPNPKVPVVLIACDPSGAGVVNQPINLLTRKRTVQYTCDGTTKAFDVPHGFDTGDNAPVVKTRDTQTGDWVTQTYGTDYSYDTSGHAQIKFNDAPTVAVQGEDNLQVTYIPYGSTPSSSSDDTGWQLIKVTKKVKRVDSGTSKTAYISNTTEDWAYSSVSFTLNNLKRNADGTAAYTVKGRQNNSWVNMNTNYIKRSLSAYSGKLTVTSKKALYNSDMPTYSTTTNTSTTGWKKSGSHYTRTTITTTTKTYRIKINYQKWVYSGTDNAEASNAFFGTTRAFIYGNGIINQVFLTASTEEKYNTRIWYSMATDPTYFPDINYVEVGSTDKPIMGLMRVGEYLGVIKQGSGTETSVYLAYPTSFENETTYAVKQSVNGIGAISNGAFNILNDEPLFLSADGVMGIEPAEDESRIIRNRSYYINKKLCAEDNLEEAISFVYDGMYWLAVNNHCYVLDGSQKLSWENTKTNFQYECYYLDNIPAQCFAKYGGQLWFTDFDGNLCKFKDESDTVQYSDDYATDDVTQNIITASGSPTDGVYQKSALSGVEIKADTLIEDFWDADVKTDLYENGAVFQFDSEYTSIEDVSIVLYPKYAGETYEETIDFTVTESGGHKYVNITAEQSKIEDLPTRGGHSLFYDFYGIYITYVSGEPIEINVGDIIKSPSAFYTVDEVNETTVSVRQGIPIEGIWGTIADDDGSPHYFKNLQKKGCMVSLLPSSDSGVEVWLKADDKDPIKIGETDAKNYELPFDFYIKKKVKKYKRLQIICKNNVIGDSFGVDQIIKSYTFGNYSKNRG